MKQKKRQTLCVSQLLICSQRFQGWKKNIIFSSECQCRQACTSESSPCLRQPPVDKPDLDVTRWYGRKDFFFKRLWVYHCGGFIKTIFARHTFLQEARVKRYRILLFLSSALSILYPLTLPQPLNRQKNRVSFSVEK